MAKRKSRATISVAGARGLVSVEDHRFDQGNWPVRFEVTNDEAHTWMRFLTAEFERRGWNTSGLGQHEARERSGTITSRAQNGDPLLDIVWEHKRGRATTIRARCYPNVLSQGELEALFETVRVRCASGAMEQYYRFGVLEYEGLPWKGELWLDDKLRLGPPSEQYTLALHGPRAILVTALVGATGPMDAGSVFENELKELAAFLSLVMGTNVGRPRQDGIWTWEFEGKTVCSVRQRGYIERQVPQEMPVKGIYNDIPVYAAVRPQGSHDPRTGLEEELSLPSDVLDLWQRFKALPDDRLAKFMQVTAKWQEALLHWQDRGTLSFALLVVACEALKPSTDAYTEHNIYDVVRELLGEEAEARLRQNQLRPQDVRNDHLHLGELYGSEVDLRVFFNIGYDPTFDEARRSLFRITRDASIEWLRRGGEVNLPPKPVKPKSFRRRLRENVFTALILATLAGIVVGWILHAIFGKGA